MLSEQDKTSDRLCGDRSVHSCKCSLLKLPVAMISSVKSNGNNAKEKHITMIICKCFILKARPDTESAFCLSLIVFPPLLLYICLYVLKLYLLFILNINIQMY